MDPVNWTTAMPQQEYPNTLSDDPVGRNLIEELGNLNDIINGIEGKLFLTPTAGRVEKNPMPANKLLAIRFIIREMKDRLLRIRDGLELLG